jgi:3-methyladenine DNA glycosylase/8-oxoguanine DNA glycosylase
VGLIANVVLLPLAPVRGVGWIAQVLTEEAERKMAAEASPARALEELAAAVANGEMTPEEAEAAEAEIIERMLAGHGADGGS